MRLLAWLAAFVLVSVGIIYACYPRREAMPLYVASPKYFCQRGEVYVAAPTPFGTSIYPAYDGHHKLKSCVEETAPQ